jgi:Alpha-kinase family
MGTDIVRYEKAALQHPDAKCVALAKDPFKDGTERVAYRFYEVAEDGKTIVGVPMVAIESRSVVEVPYGIAENVDRINFVAKFMKTRQMAHRLAEQFNDQLKTNRRIHEDTPLISFIDASIYELDDMGIGKTCVLVEEKLDDNKWQKWEPSKVVTMVNTVDCTYTDEDVSDEEESGRGITKIVFTPSQVAHAFSHFSYLGRQKLVCGLQGVYDEKKNLLQLSDPVIHFHNPHCNRYRRIKRRDVYGRKDCGLQGMNEFFATHNCNEQGHLCEMVTRDFL